MRPALFVRLSAGVARAELRRKAVVLWSGEVNYAEPEELGLALTRLLTGDSLPSRPAALRVELESPLAQVRTLSGLPPVSAAQLKALVAIQSGRFFRRNGKALVTDAAWRSRGPARVAVAAAVEEPWVEALAEAARSAGIPLLDVRPASLSSQVRLRLVSSGEAARRRRGQLLAARRLAFAAATIWIAAIATLSGRMHRERLRLDREIAGLEEPVAAVARARRAVDSAAAMTRGITEAATGRGRALASLAAISRALSDSAYVTAVVIDARGRGEIGVTARRSSEVLAGLDREPSILAPKLEGSVLRESIGGRDWERFSVSLGGGVAP